MARYAEMLCTRLLGRFDARQPVSSSPAHHQRRVLQRLQDLRVAGKVKTLINRALSDAVPLGLGGTDSSLKSLEHNGVR